MSWSTKKQPVASQSITEAEYRSLTITTAELYWLRMLFKEIHISLPVAPILWCDNISALALASNPVYHARTKHIEVDYHFVREKVVNRDIILKFISTNHQVADVFTKGLSSPRFLKLKAKLIVVLPPITLRVAIKVCGTREDHPVNEATINVDNTTKSATYGKLMKTVSHPDSNYTLRGS